MGIAEQMGRTLQRTSISVNIKERLDFSCALFGPDGSLVANAPHLPVHLGAMSEANRFQVSKPVAAYMVWNKNIVFCCKEGLHMLLALPIARLANAACPSPG